MKDESENTNNVRAAPAANAVSRRDFLKTACRVMALSLAAVGFRRLVDVEGGERVWQIDPKKCVQCGRCATECVLNPSAVRCVHAYDVCGYCKLCGGYHQPNAKQLNTAAENQVCPTGAIVRTFVEDPFYEYRVVEELCNGCGKCVKGCSSFGNGSLYLQVRHHLCAGCNECRIAARCPAGAIGQVPLDRAYYV